MTDSPTNDSAEFSLEIDGERFVVRTVAGPGGGYRLDWITGPNPGYGFSIGWPAGGPASEPVEGWVPSNEVLLSEARNFLSMIDPATGYIAEE